MYKKYLLQCAELIDNIWHPREYYFDTKEEMISFVRRNVGLTFHVDTAFELNRIDDDIFALDSNLSEEKIDINNEPVYIKRIRQLVNQRGMTLQECAKQCDISPMTLSRILYNKIPLHERILNRLADVLCASPEYILGYDDKCN